MRELPLLLDKKYEFLRYFAHWDTQWGYWQVRPIFDKCLPGLEHCVRKSNFAQRYGLFLHLLIAYSEGWNVSKGWSTDHISKDRGDNRLCNLKSLPLAEHLVKHHATQTTHLRGFEWTFYV